MEPAYREVGLGGRLIREVFNIAAKLGLAKVAFELVVQREKEAARSAARAASKKSQPWKTGSRTVGATIKT